MSEGEKSVSVSEKKICFSGSSAGKSSASWFNKTLKGKHSGVHQNPSQNPNPLHLKERRRQRRCGGRSRVRLRPVLQDKPTNGKYDGEKSCMSDYKRHALAKDKLVFISYLLSPLFNIFLHLICSSPLHVWNFQNYFLHAGIFLALFPFYKKTNFFLSFKILWEK